MGSVGGARVLGTATGTEWLWGEGERPASSQETVLSENRHDMVINYYRKMWKDEEQIDSGNSS